MEFLGSCHTNDVLLKAKNIKLKHLRITLLIVFLLFSFLAFFIVSIEATGANWLAGWTYRKSHEINSATGAGTNYQVQIIVVNSSSADSGNTVNINNKMRLDFGDVRFTDDDGNTTLDYWMETLNTGANATFWVEVADSLESSNVTIYVYYGKADATTTSNGTDTFVFFDDMTGTLTDKWTVTSGTWAYSSGELVHSGGGDDKFLTCKTAHPVNCSIEGKVKLSNVTSWPNVVAFSWRASTTWANSYCGDLRPADPTTTHRQIINRRISDSGTLLASQNYGYSADTYYLVSVFSAGSQLRFQLNRASELSAVDTTWSGTVFLIRANIQSGKTATFDDIRIRKYIEPEPAQSTWGNEETNGDSTPPTYSGISANTTVAGALCSFNCLVNDDTNVSTYIFSTNNTGTWTNDTATTFSNFFNTTAAWANVTKTLNDTIDNVVSYLWYANDTSNNWSSSDQYNLTLTAPYRPSLQMTPDNITCRIYLETFSVQINVTNAIDTQAFNFTIYYDSQVLNCSSVSWGELGTGTMTEIDTTNGILEGNVAGSPLNGNHWLLSITFQADKVIIWKVGLANELEGKIWFHQAQLNFTDNSTLQYIEGGINQIDVNQAAYTFLPIQGDVNNDGTVDVMDLRIIAFYYGKTPADPEWPAASKYDLTNDNTIDISDLRVAATNFGFTYP